MNGQEFYKQLHAKPCPQCSGSVDESAPEGTLCIHCRRHNRIRDKANGIIVDAMIVIARAAVAEKATGDSRKVEEARAQVMKDLIAMDSVNQI